MNNITIHHLPERPEYITTVANWIYNAFIDPERMTLQEVIDHCSNRYTDQLPIALIALDENNECQGTISLFDNDLGTREDLTPWLAALYVNEEYRGKSLAKFLIQEIIKKAKDFNYSQIYLRTEEAARYYLKNGWTLLEETVDEHNKETTIFYREI